MKIVFMGTPDFAVASLNALLEAGCNIVAVVTAPDKPAGRGQKLNESAVKKYAISRHLPVLQPAKLKDPDFLDELRSYQPELQVVVAFRMLPETVWTLPPRGTVNLHASLLPAYRGAAPINWAVINGEKESGVTTFFLRHEIDTGNIIFADRVEIGPDETAGELHDKLMEIGARLLVKTVKAIENGQYEEKPQDLMAESVTHAPKISKDDCLINWNQQAAKVYNHIRGLSPHPTAFTTFQGKTLKIYGARPLEEQSTLAAGQFITDGKTFLKFACADKLMAVTDLQLEGKRRMGIEEFLRGIRL